MRRRYLKRNTPPGIPTILDLEEPDAIRGTRGRKPRPSSGTETTYLTHKMCPRHMPEATLLPASCFSRHSYSSDGLQPYCKECYRRYRQDRIDRTTKRCAGKCDKRKPLTEFDTLDGPVIRNTDGLQRKCRECKKQERAERKAQREKEAATRRTEPEPEDLSWAFSDPEPEPVPLPPVSPETQPEAGVATLSGNDLSAYSWMIFGD